MIPTISYAQPLILASGSRYRAELLKRLALPFTTEVSQVDETPLQGEAAIDLAQRLALVKAIVVATKRPGRWVLGSDQVVVCGTKILGKPLTELPRSRSSKRSPD